MKTAIVGLWTLVSWERVYADGQATPYHSGPVGGFLHYAADGRMAVSLFATDEPLVLSTYAGTYACLGEDVIHYPVAGNSPGGIDRPKRRHLKVAGRAMRMESPWHGSAAESYKHRLSWQKT